MRGYGNYDRYPEKKIAGAEGEAASGWPGVCEAIREKAAGRARALVAVDCYPGVDIPEVAAGLAGLGAAEVLFSGEVFIPDREYAARTAAALTSDRVFGVMSCQRLEDFVDEEAMEAMRRRVAAAGEGITLLIGVGASLVAPADILVVADLARWEIQTRMRQGMCNWKTGNSGEDFSRKFKRGYFLEWRLADRHKKPLLLVMDFLLDTNRKGQPSMVTGKGFRRALEQFAREPFRLVPYFDPGVWGGQWMKEVCGLDKEAPNYAWSFDGVPEENSLYARFGDVRVEFPAMDLVLSQPVPLLGDRVHARFGAEFPIRFDLLDTVGGGSLSLQVHPLTGYIQETFGMHYTQDESYYILDAEPGAAVCLGLREGVDREAMVRDLYRAQEGEGGFPAEKYINRFPAKKHDHFLIPAGTVHCSGRGAMVLEISATPYIFTFKLWDWARLGLDGKPRPIHIGHGVKNICWERATQWVKENLVNRFVDLSAPEGVRAQRTGLHPREFIETERHTSAGAVRHETGGSVHMLNLVEGAEALVESPEGAFAPFHVHYAETFIVPESVKSYTVRPCGESQGQPVTTIKAYVRT